ncbi:MAG: amidohydrolase [Ignavibacteria bacterium]|nr:amidohydrolase [Ignavibacteria bacterium]
MKIDVHTHILPEKWPDLNKKYNKQGFLTIEHHKPCCAKMMIGDRVFREITDNSWSHTKRIEECDEHQVSMQVLSTVPVMFSYWAKPNETLDLAKHLNDHIAQTVNDNPSRFIGLGTLPMQDAKLAVKELERIMKDLGLAGIEIGTHIQGKNLDDPEICEVLGACEEMNAAVFVHPWDMMGKERMPEYWLPWLVGMPAETALAICSMIFGGVFEKFKKLRVCFAHGGGSFPFTIGRIEHGFKVRPDLVQTKNMVNPRNYLGKFYLDSLVHDESALKFLIDLIGEDNIVLGSDYPFPLGEHIPGKLIEGMAELNNVVKEKLLWKNAAEFLGITELIKKMYSEAGN